MKKKIELIIPEKLGDIKLKQYQKYVKEIQGVESDTIIRQKLLTCFTGVEFKDIEKMPNEAFNRISNQVSKIIDGTANELKTTFTFKGIEYGFIPELDNITLGEFIDLDSHIGNWEMMHFVMGVLYRPITSKKGDKYLIEPHKAVINEDFKDLPLDVVLGAMVFFYRLSNVLIDTLATSLEAAAKDKKIQEQILTQTSIKNGDGKFQSIPLVMETLQNMKQLQKRFYLPHLIN